VQPVVGRASEDQPSRIGSKQSREQAMEGIEQVAILWTWWCIFVVVLCASAFFWNERQRRKEFDETFGLPPGWRKKR